MPATVAIGPQDENLRLTGSTGTAFETVTTTANGTGAYYGPNQTFRARLLIAGAVSGTTPTLTVKFQDATALAGTYTDMGIAFAAQSTTMAVTTLSLTAAPLLTVTTSATRPYVRVVKTVTGTTPSFANVAVLIETAQPF